MVSKVVANEVAIAEVAVLLNEGRRVVLPVKGQSMLPFIVGGRESVELVGCREAAVGDVVLAMTREGHYVVHRVIGADGQGRYTLMGDGNLAGVEHCTAEQLVGRAEYVVTPKGHRRPLHTAGHRRAWRAWMRLRPVRRWLLAIYRRLPYLLR